MAAPIVDFDESHYTEEFIKNLYDINFHNNHWNIFRPRNLNAAKIFYDTTKPKSVIDFGCSIGTYLEYFMKQGAQIRGFEFCFDECTPAITQVAGLINHITFGDVTKIIDLDEKFDLAMSLEVAEHIPESCSDILVENLCNAATKNIIFTAAGLGQGGTGHINCQEKSFWIQKFNLRGWTQDLELEQQIKNKMNPRYENDGNNEFPIVWDFVYNNLMVFKHDRH